MNYQCSKKILFNKSTLMNLKAELLKKQEEVEEKKRLPHHKMENFKPPPAKPSMDGEDYKYKKSFKDSLHPVDTEELEAYKKTKFALEKKAAIYEHLSNPAGDSQLASKYLVDFNTKKHQDSEEPPPAPNATNSSFDNAENNSDDDDDSEWTEFVDCLGRTRKCLKSDLELYKEKDCEFMNSISKKSLTDSGEVAYVQERQTNVTEKPFLVQKTNDYLQSLREKWELKERELLAKDKDIHYQDLLFDEARIHGVGYYAFSTDEKVRERQMEELLGQHEETLRAQAEAEAKRRQREALVAARLKAARARQRLRAGLPPEDPEENQKDFNSCLIEFLNKQKEEAEARAKEEDRKIKEQIEIERQKLRETYVREWDRGKEGVEDKQKKFKEMTQEEYVEQERAKRIKEFAPLQSTSSSKPSYTFDEGGHKTFSDVSPKSWSDVRPKIKTPPPPEISNYIAEKGLYFSTTKKLESLVKYKNFVKLQEPIPIENEVSVNESDDVRVTPGKRKVCSGNVEVPPPPTYEYYGPVNKKTKAKKPFESDLREAYAQGTKSLETKPSNRILPQQYDFSLE